MSRPFTLSAPAKINTYLYVGRRMPGGLHRIKTTFQEVSLSDSLRFEPEKSKVRVQCADGRVPTGRRNLIVLALLKLKAELGKKGGVRVTLEKRIPMGAGLGGGSSDAAAALKGAWRIWNGTHWKKIPAAVRKIAIDCGADVPFFLTGGRAFAEGVGERIRPAPVGRRKWLVVLYPGVSVSTKDAYRWLDESRKRRSVPAPPRLPLFNSFEEVILPRFPRIAAAKKALVDAGCRPVLMSGSGSAVFGFVPGRKKGRRIIRSLARRFGRVFLCHTRA